MLKITRNNVKIQHYRNGKNSLQTSRKESLSWSIFSVINFSDTLDEKNSTQKENICIEVLGHLYADFFHCPYRRQNPILEIGDGILNCKTPDF